MKPFYLYTRIVFAVASVLSVVVPASAQSAPEELKVTIGKSLVIDFPSDIARLSTSDPNVVDAVAVTTREVLLHAKNYGSATVVVWSKSGQRVFYNINVDYNLEPIRKLLRDTFPKEDIRVQATRDSLSLTGRVSSQAVSDRAAVLVSPMAKTVVNNLIVAAGAEKQIVLRVKFAELNRTAAEQFAVNLVSTGAANTPGSLTTGQFAPPLVQNLRGTIPGRAEGTNTTFNITEALNVFAFRPDLNLSAFVRALRNQGLLQIMAEPNLVTTNGKEAHFLVGGEFPVPILQGGANAAVTIQFKEFGIRLTFLPVITEANTVKLYVRPEVSTVDIANAVAVSGFTIPALSTRRMDTNVELALGQSFVIAGLMDDRVTENLSRIPGLANIPLLGAIFRSRQENKNKSELVVMVTPEITAPLNPGDPKPGLVMPREFLTPVTPDTTGALIGRPDGGKSKSAQSRRDKKS